MSREHKPILTDVECPSCGSNETKHWSHPMVHPNERVCVKCTKVIR